MTSANDTRPDFALTVDGKELPLGKHDDIIEVEVVEQIGKLAQARVVLRNWGADSNAPEEDDDTFKLEAGKDMVIKLGWGSDLTEVFDGVIAATRTICRFGDVPRLEVVGRCRGISLRGTERFKVWTDKSDFDAASAMASDASLSAKGKAAFTHPFLVQHRRSDWDFLLDRAQSLGYSLYVRGTDLNFQAPNTSGDPVAELEWPEDLHEAELTTDLREAWVGAKTQSWNPDEKALAEAEAQGSASVFPLGKRSEAKTYLGNAKITASRTRNTFDSAPLDVAELQAWGQALVDQSRANACHGTARFEGDPTVRIDSLISLTGIGQEVDGPHYITWVSHTLEPGSYQTRVRVGAPSALYGSPSGNGPSRAFDPIHSLLIATVESFEDSDAKLGRVQVRFPWMSAEEPPIWARLGTPNAGGSRGILFVPEPEDEVLVQFVDGDPRFPVVVGSLWNGQDAPPDPYDPEKNDRRAIVSRSGHTFVMDDGSDAPQVSITTAAGQELLIDDTSGSEKIQVTDKTGNEILMDSSGIALTAASGKTIALTASGGTIEMSATTIKATADSEFNVQANSTLGLKCTGPSSLEGAQTSVKGTAMVEVQAPMVKIN